ncbi:hypothetical protein [Prevotella falsenii]|uniref:hypothetical protein n=1 Tax=Prevotella falsenii TaxID=515414 RepID=UPI000467F86C|nr:hypothetical protein [Prevotella falsenii]
MKTIKKQQNKMRIFLTIITMLVANGLWAQKNSGYSPKFKKGQSAVYEFSLEQTQSGTPDSINTMLDFTAIIGRDNLLSNEIERREPNLSCKVRLTVLDVSPFTTTMQVDLLESVNYSKKKIESFSDSLFYHWSADILKKRPLILTFTSDMKSYVVSNSEDLLPDLSEVLLKLVYGENASRLATPLYSYNRYAAQVLRLMDKSNIRFLANFYILYAPSLLDLIQTFANPSLTEGTVTKGRPLDGTNREMKFFTSTTTQNKKGEWTYISDFEEYTTPVYSSDRESDWEYGAAVDSVEIDTVDSYDYEDDTAMVDTLYTDTAEWDSTEWDSVAEDYEYEPDTALTEADRMAKTHSETRIGKDGWPTEINKTIMLEDDGVAWIYRRKLKKVEEIQRKK